MRVPGGTYYLLAFHPGYLPEFYGCEHIWEPACRVIVESDIDNVDFALTPLVRILMGRLFFGGRIVEGDTSMMKTDIPVSGAEIFIMNPNTEEVLSYAITDQDGYFYFDNLDVGTYKVGASKPFYRFTYLEPYLSLAASRSDALYRMWRYTGIPENEAGVKPLRFSIVAYPNPFNAQVAIAFSIETDAEIKLDIFDITGKVVRKLGDGFYSKGNYIALWDGRTDKRGELPSGIYFAKLTANGRSTMVKLILLK